MAGRTREVVREASTFGRGCGASAPLRRRAGRQVRLDQLDELERGRELVLLAQEEVLDAATQRIGCGIATQFDDVGTTVWVLGIGAHDVGRPQVD